MDQRRVPHVEGTLELLEGLVDSSHLGVAPCVRQLVATLS